MSTVKIQSLTEQQTRKLPEYRDKWVKIGRGTGVADRPRAEIDIGDAYRAAGFDPPTVFVWTLSPLQGAIAAALIKKGTEGEEIVGGILPSALPKILEEAAWTKSLEDVRKDFGGDLASEVHNQAFRCGYGSHDASWLSTYDVLKDVGVKGAEVLEPLMRLAANIGWWWPFVGLCIVSERPTEIHFDDRGNLHSVTGHAIAYADSFALYAVHGVRVPERVVLGTYSVEDALREQNSEVKRIMIELMGYDRFFGEAGGTIVHRDIDGYDHPRELISVPMVEAAAGHIMAVHVICPTTGRHYFLGVPASVKTCQEAVASTFGKGPTEYAPEVES